MSFRATIQKLIQQDATATTLRERAADLQARIPAPKLPPEAPAPDRAEQVAHAGPTGDVLAVSGIDHRDGTVSYSDATGKAARRPMAHWVAFVATELHARVASEITRQVNASKLQGKELYALESRLRRQLRSDAVFSLAFRSDRAFKAGEDYRSGAEPETLADRSKADASLLALAPKWEAAFQHYQQVSEEQLAITVAANEDGRDPRQRAPDRNGRPGSSRAARGASGRGSRRRKKRRARRCWRSVRLRTRSPKCRLPHWPG